MLKLPLRISVAFAAGYLPPDARDCRPRCEFRADLARHAPTDSSGNGPISEAVETQSSRLRLCVEAPFLTGGPSSKPGYFAFSHTGSQTACDRYALRFRYRGLIFKFRNSILWPSETLSG